MSVRVARFAFAAFAVSASVPARADVVDRIFDFTNDAAGRRAKQIADGMPLCVFPRRDPPNPVALGANRQADIVDLRNGYFSNNPLGLWIHYTDSAFNTSEGRKRLADLEKKNGLAPGTRVPPELPQPAIHRRLGELIHKKDKGRLPTGSRPLFCGAARSER